MGGHFLDRDIALAVNPGQQVFLTLIEDQHASGTSLIRMAFIVTESPPLLPNGMQTAKRPAAELRLAAA
ncbi:hypothetical protein D3C72_2251280 [compost metagenome]